jgi:DNA-binding CsgD family transcriptional regulator
MGRYTHKTPQLSDRLRAPGSSLAAVIREHREYGPSTQSYVDMAGSTMALPELERGCMGAAQGEIVGRERELATLARFVDDLDERRQDLLLEGEAGIGKTTLWRAGVQAARDAGRRVLVSRPGENDAMASYSAIGDLIGDVFDEALADAPGPQRRALEIALHRRERGSQQPDPRAIALGVREAFRTLSTASQLVLAVDDIQWLDRSSARALAFALHRLHGEPVALLAARRLDAGSPADLMTALRDRDVVRIDVGPLDIKDVGRILHDRLSRPLAPPFVTRIYEASRGNPFFSLEIAHGSIDREPAAGRPLPIPGDVGDILRARIKRMSANARDVTLVVSAMARPTIEVLRAARPRPSTADAGLTEAEEAGLVIVDHESIHFVHPLLGSAAYWSASQRKRKAIHGRLAQVIPDLEERARHVALMGPGPDPDRASLVHEAADHARLRGAPLAAAELLELSVELTPSDDEAQLCRRKRDAALNRFDAGDVRVARAMLETLIDTTSSRQQQAMTKVELAVRYYNDVDRVHDLLSSALPDAGEGFLPIILANLAWVAIGRLDPERAAHHARAAIELAEHAPDQTPLRVALGALGHAEALLGRDAVPTMRRAMAIDAGISPGEAAHPSGIRAQQVLWEGRIAEALRLSRESDRAYVEAGLELMRNDSLPVLSEVECAAGEWGDATLHANEAYDIVVDAGLDEMRDQVLYAKAHIAALMGRVDDARRDATEGASLAAKQGNPWAELANRSVLGFIALSVDDPAEVVRVLDPAERILAGSGIVEPGVFTFLPDLAEALATVGHLERAKRLVDRLHEQGTALDRSLALATAARGRALIAAGLGDPLGALLELEHALDQHDRVAIPFESARTLLIQGETLRRMKRKREARDSLERARSQFRALGAALWEARADSTLARLGGRTASPTELSETERRVADLVALGLTNKEAAERLFLSVKTVESNLRRVYRKLGVRSRTELARRHRTST